jgi:magnesium-transporting ATPase (P-type)
MPKYKKKGSKIAQEEESRQQLIDQKRFMYSSSLRSLIISGVCFVLSFLFNGNLIQIDVAMGSAVGVLLVLLKALLITLFYIFTLVGLANTMELRGKPSSLREIIIVGILALIQGVLSLPVFLLSLLGVILASLYLWAIQVRVERF